MSLRGHRRACVVTVTLSPHTPTPTVRAGGAQVTASQHTPFPRPPQGRSGAGLRVVGRLDETCPPQSVCVCVRCALWLESKAPAASGAPGSRAPDATASGAEPVSTATAEEQNEM